MQTPTTVDLDDLEAVLRRCLAECRTRLGPQVELGADHYWLVEPVDAFDLTKVPSPNAGQISDDVLTITQAAREVDPLIVWHELGHALGILTRLAALLSP